LTIWRGSDILKTIDEFVMDMDSDEEQGGFEP
jgi:hypothetical protein